MPSLLGERVRVHKNLQRGDWTITVRGKKVASVEAITLADVTFHIWPEGQRRSRIGKRRVHLWAQGIVCASVPILAETALHYCPKEGTAGMTARRDGSDVEHCQFVVFRADGAFAKGEVK